MKNILAINCSVDILSQTSYDSVEILLFIIYTFVACVPFVAVIQSSFDACIFELSTVISG